MEMESPGEAKDREEGTDYLEKEIKEISTEDGVVGAEDEDDSMASSRINSGITNGSYSLFLFYEPKQISR